MSSTYTSWHLHKLNTKKRDKGDDDSEIEKDILSRMHVHPKQKKIKRKMESEFIQEQEGGEEGEAWNVNGMYSRLKRGEIVHLYSEGLYWPCIIVLYILLFIYKL